MLRNTQAKRAKEKKSVSVAILTLSILLVGTHATFAQDEPFPDDPFLGEQPFMLEPQMPGILEATGTVFEVTGSEYLNITVESSERIHLRLESVPEMVTMDIEAATEALSTTLTLRGFLPSTTYYKYEDNYHNLAPLTTDASGSYTYLQDLSQQHLVFIQPRPSTIFLSDSGWSDSSAGIWDATNQTATLTRDVTQTIQIDSDHITLDGKDRTLTGSGTGYGIYLNGRTGVTVNNVNVHGFSVGIRIYDAGDNALIANNASLNSSAGITLVRTSDNTLTGNTANSNTRFGIRLAESTGNLLTGNTVNSSESGVTLYNSKYNTLTGHSASECHYTFVLKNGSDGNIVSGNSADLGTGHAPHGFYLESSSNNILIDNVARLHYYGIALGWSVDNIIRNNTISHNWCGIIFARRSEVNQIYNNNFIDNEVQAWSTWDGGINVFNLDPPIGGNYWNDLTSPDVNPEDGFVDIPYVIHVDGGQDNLPWAIPGGWLNQPPIADAGGPYSAECQGTVTEIQLDGTGSSDPDGDPLAYAWTTDCSAGAFDDPASPTPRLTIDTPPCPIIAFNVTLTVTDPSGDPGSDSDPVTVMDTTPPMLSVPPGVTVECEAPTDPSVTGQATATDTCDPNPAVTYSDSVTPGTCPQQSVITRTWTATDACALSSSGAQTITVVDTTPPVLAVDTTPITVVDADCSGEEVVILPAATATDNCDPSPTVSHDGPATFPAGETTIVTYTATDACGNMSTETVEVTVLYGANIQVQAVQHIVGLGQKPGSVMEPLVGIEVFAFDTAEAQAACGGVSHHSYQCILDSVIPVSSAITDASGVALIDVPEGEYMVIAPADGSVLLDPIGGVVGGLACAQQKPNRIRQIVKADGKKVPAKITERLTGSELLIVEPEYIVWDATDQLYPFVFEAIGDWGVTVSVAPPDGFVADTDNLSEWVDSEIEALQFTITEVGSDLVPTETVFQVNHKGRSHTVRSRIGIQLTPEYARSRGFDVRELRARGLIREQRARGHAKD